MSSITSTSVSFTNESEAFTKDDLVTTAFVALPAIALASIGGIGIVGAFGALGLSSLELGAIGAASGYAARKATKRASKPSAPSKPKVDWDAAMKRSASTPSTSALCEPTEIDDLRSGRF